MGTWVNWTKKVPQVPRWAKTSIFSIFYKTFRKWRKSSYSHSRTTKLYKFTHLDGKWAHERIEPKKFPRSAKTSIFSIFWKVLENEESPHILTPGQLKYTNSLIWMENGHMSELSQSIPQVCGRRKLQFFLFSEQISKMKKILIFSLQDN